ncbi:hypothetical protein [Terriglobus sp.]|uniref:hypothetical protein n=1 Tax=Terriglobus sp. TaxID=1889013 RepID=UPI003AFFC2C8
MGTQTKARVFEDELGQAVQLPEGFRFATSEVYLKHDPEKGTLTFSEKPLPVADVEEMAELFARINASGGFEFDLDRDQAPHAEREEL